MSRDLPLKERRGKRPIKDVPCSFCPVVMRRELSFAVNRCPKCKDAWRKAWAARNPEIIAAAQKRYKIANAEVVEAYNKKWKQEHPERVKVHNRRARRRWRKNEQKRNAAVLASLPCPDCGYSHSLERRLAILRRCADLSPTEVRDAYPCLWGPPDDQDSYAARRFYLDRALLSGKQAEVAA